MKQTSEPRGNCARKSEVYKALRDELVKVFEELKRIDNGQNVDSDLLTVISQITTILGQMKGEI